MSETIILKKKPKIEFQLFDNGFKLIDGQKDGNSGFYPYSDLQSIELNSVWFPKIAKWLRIVTWISNGVPYFPDAESCKKANLVIHFKKSKLGIWLTDSYMADKAKRLEKVLYQNKSNNFCN